MKSTRIKIVMGGGVGWLHILPMVRQDLGLQTMSHLKSSVNAKRWG